MRREALRPVARPRAAVRSPPRRPARAVRELGRLHLRERLLRVRELERLRLGLERRRVGASGRQDRRRLHVRGFSVLGRDRWCSHQRRGYGAALGRGRRTGRCKHEHLPDANHIGILDVVPGREVAIVEPVVERDLRERVAALHRVRRRWRASRCGAGAATGGGAGSVDGDSGARSLTGAGGRVMHAARSSAAISAAATGRALIGVPTRCALRCSRSGRPIALMRFPAAAARSAPRRRFARACRSTICRSRSGTAPRDRRHPAGQRQHHASADGEMREQRRGNFARRSGDDDAVDNEFLTEPG